MNIINQRDSSNAIIGGNSKIQNCSTIERTGWFFSGFILPIIVGIIVEIIIKGGLSNFFQIVLGIFK